MGKTTTSSTQLGLHRLIATRLIGLSWFKPRTWHKQTKPDDTSVTTKAELPDADAARRSRDREQQYNRAFIEKHTRDITRSRGESAPANDDDLEMALSYGKERAPPGYNAPSGYTRPATQATGMIYVPSG
jgi:hypothetical protein